MNTNFILNNESCRFSGKSCCRNSAHMLPVTDWMSDLPEAAGDSDIVEVQFKNTRKGYYHNNNHLPLEKGVKVAVESNPGHDIGEVTLTGPLVLNQMRKNRIDTTRYEIRSVYRIATEQDLQRAEEAHAKEQATMIRARQLAKSLGLEMKIGDVEYQGDGQKGIFYYIADGRVDFRQLIKVYAETFRIRIEMKQIGARQEAGRIGGTGPCGRELCCSTWMSNFRSVGTGGARLQNLSLNPQKLAGQCAKLKCCLNYEVPVYEDAVKDFPPRNTPLETADATYYLFSTDPLRGELTYSSDPRIPANLQVLSAQQAWDIINANKRGEKPLDLGGKTGVPQSPEVGYLNVVGQDDLTRFDKKRTRNNNRNNNRDARRDHNRPHSDNRNNNDSRNKQPNPNRRADGNRPH